MNLQFRRLSEVDRQDIIALNTHPLVLRQMPLGTTEISDAECAKWVEGKEAQWKQHGYGPWAFVADGGFIGWGGLQYENGDADLALVLHPTYWGLGYAVYQEIIRRAFMEMGLPSVTILLPPTRTRIKGLSRLGFQPDGQVDYDGERFVRYRLFNDTAGRS